MPDSNDRAESRKQGGARLSESDLYKELGKLTKDRDRWEENVPYVSSLLSYESEKIQAKAHGCLPRWDLLIRNQSGTWFL